MSSPGPNGAAAAPALARLDPAVRALLAGRLHAVQARMRAAEAAAGRRPGAVQLLAVSKTFGPETVAAAAQLGQRLFGENYAQEAVAKMEALRTCGELPPLEWHFIGPIQSNKTRLIAAHFQWVHSVDRASIARRLSDQRPADLPPLQALIEVNLGGEASKSGVAPADLPELARAIVALPRLQLRGLMAIPAAGLSPPDQHAAFARLRQLLEELQHLPDLRPAGSADAADAAGAGLDTLSMGMSADFEAAIAQGATLVRVGSAIFGERA
jgi:pyridoxal phosphate enzyme (YggS family)